MDSFEQEIKVMLTGQPYTAVINVTPVVVSQSEPNTVTEEERTEEIWERFCTIIGEEEDDFVLKVMTKPQFKLALKELLNQKK